MADSNHFESFKRGSLFWNRWRGEQMAADVDFKADLSGAELYLASTADLERMDLRNADCRAANFGSLNMTGSNFSGANLDDTMIQRATLAESCFRRASLRRTNLIKTDFTGADLTDADCTRGDFRATNLSRTIFDGTLLLDVDFNAAELNDTKLYDLDLGSTKGLYSVIHMGPSSVGIDTLLKSRGRIPVEFLAGAGIPREFAAGVGFKEDDSAYPSCFISHCSKDEVFVDKLVSDLKASSILCWQNGAEGGRELMAQIKEAIYRHEKVLVILSSNSITSDWVKTEILMARERELIEKTQILFPILIEPFEVLENWLFSLAPHIRRYYIPDFKKWRNPECYKLAFEALLRSLRQSKIQ